MWSEFCFKKVKKYTIFISISCLFTYFFHFHRNLATHLINVHSDEKHFKCPQCDYKAKSQLLITKHVRRFVYICFCKLCFIPIFSHFLFTLLIPLGYITKNGNIYATYVVRVFSKNGIWPIILWQFIRKRNHMFVINVSL